MAKIIYTLDDFDRNIADIYWKINGATLSTSWAAKTLLESELLTNAQKLKKKTQRFDKYKKGIIVNTQEFKSQHYFKVSALGAGDNDTKRLRMFTASREEPRYTGQRIRRKAGGNVKVTSTGNARRYTGILKNLNPFISGVMERIKQIFDNKMKQAIK